jgi:glycosyltransferase involved in cell wall biosynthesis
MRIGIMAQSVNETMGGIGVYSQEIVRAMLRVDSVNEYILIYPGFGTARTRRGQFHQHANVTEIETEPGLLSAKSYSLLEHGPRPLQKMRSALPLETYWDQVVVPRMAEKYGVDVLFNPHLTVPVRGRFGKVTVLHNVEYHTVPNVYNWRMYCWWYMLEKLILPAADRLISIANVITEAIREHVNYPMTKVRMIYHGVSDKFRVETDYDRLARAREEYCLPEHFILFVGRLYPQKNFATLVRAFARLKDTIPHRLVVVGQPRYKYDGDLNLIRELGIEDRVGFLNHVPNNDLPKIYNLATCFVMPSLFEACPLALLEAMACGCPIVGARAGGITELVDGAAILFDPHSPHSPEELSQAILKVTCEPDVRRDLTERVLVRAREFTWERTARETLEVFKELA